VDLPGFGGTETPPRRLAVEEYDVLLGSVLDALLGEIHASRCVLIGYSMDAQIATDTSITARIAARDRRAPVPRALQRRRSRCTSHLSFCAELMSPAGRVIVRLRELRWWMQDYSYAAQRHWRAPFERTSARSLNR
jgi:pimeloyl-ACP methyl ester carboxylesterase